MELQMVRPLYCGTETPSLGYILDVADGASPLFTADHDSTSPLYLFYICLEQQIRTIGFRKKEEREDAYHAIKWHVKPIPALFFLDGEEIHGFCCENRPISTSEKQAIDALIRSYYPFS